MPFIILLICFCLLIVKIKMQITNSHFKFGSSESRGVMLNAITACFPHLSPSWRIMQCSGTVGPQLLPQCWPMWAPGTGRGEHISSIPKATAQLWGQGQRVLGVRWHQPLGIHLCNIPNPSPWKATTQPASRAHRRGSQPPWCPGCWLGAAWQAQGFPLLPCHGPGPALQLRISCRRRSSPPWAPRDTASEIQLPGFSALRLFCTLFLGFV